MPTSAGRSSTQFPSDAGLSPLRRPVKTRVFETGLSTPGRWRTERVDVLTDYRRRFGHPPGNINRIGVSANTNHTAAVDDVAVATIRAVPAVAGR